MKYLSLIVISVAALLLSACGTHRKADNPFVVVSEATHIEPSIVGGAQALNPAVIYRTDADYSDFVPVTMNDNRTEVMNYPAPGDIYYKGELAKPTQLADGYLLDNRGIGKNSVFTDYTYEQYSKLLRAPTIEELKKHIKSLYPFTDIYVTASPRSDSNGVDFYNRIIASGFQGCTRVPIVPHVYFVPEK
ncbi:MAG: hypothetical protein LKF31_05915 [Muribaculaceae bacterium]|jgi:hypothetical protein|nr:hypothetical protein [Muribaculaceae bacterium]